VTTLQQETRPSTSGFSWRCYDQSYTHCFHEGTGKRTMGYKGYPLNISILRSMDIDKEPVLLIFWEPRKVMELRTCSWYQTHFLHVVVVAQRVIGDDSLFGLEANLVYWLWERHLLVAQHGYLIQGLCDAIGVRFVKLDVIFFPLIPGEYPWYNGKRKSVTILRILGSTR